MNLKHLKDTVVGISSLLLKHRLERLTILRLPFHERRNVWNVLRKSQPVDTQLYLKEKNYHCPFSEILDVSQKTLLDFHYTFVFMNSCFRRLEKKTLLSVRLTQRLKLYVFVLISNYLFLR